MALLSFRKSKIDETGPELAGFLEGVSIEVMPRTAAKIENFADLFPHGTRVYIAHIEGTPVDEMVETVKRVSDQGMTAMPHVPARLIADRAVLDLWLKRYAEEGGASQALVLAGGPKTPAGDFHSSMQLLETGLFDTYGFTRLHVAGHPEGNKDIDPDGSSRLVDEAARWKQAFNERTDADMAMTTQFAFDAAPVIEWADRLQSSGITLPIHIGVAGPAKLQTLIKFAIACGVGPSISVLQKRARDVSKLIQPFEPTRILSDIASHAAANPDSLIKSAHIFPLGGIRPSAEYVQKISNQSGAAGRD